MDGRVGLLRENRPGDDSGDEELGAVGVLSSIGHAEHSLLGVLQLEVLIREFLAIDRLSTRAVSLCKVSSLDHKGLDNSVEARTLVTKAFLASSQSSEILCGLQRNYERLQVKRLL